MTKSQKTVLIVAIVAVVILAAGYGVWDLWIRHPRCFDCGDGHRCTIDTRQFATQYSAYSLQLEATLNDKQKLSAKLDPVELNKLSEATQNANEFRKYVVNGFNACAISKAQYEQLGSRFQALDSMAREINELTGKPSLTSDEQTKLAELITDYGAAAQELASEK